MSSSEDMIYVEEQTMQSLVDGLDGNYKSVCSDDSDILVLNSICDLPTSLASAATAAKLNNGNVHEQRIDIQQTLQIPILLEENLHFKDKTVLADAIDRVGAREHLDKDIENEIDNIDKIIQNDKLIDGNLIEAAKVAKEQISKARKIASDGQTTVKRAMEVIENALPVFEEAVSKKAENNDLNPDFMEEINAYQDCQHMNKKAAYDIEMQELQEKKALQHLNKSIELVDADVKKITEKYKNVLLQERLTSFIKTKSEVEGIVADEKAEIHEYLTHCDKDLKLIAVFQEEQTQRFNASKKNHETEDAKLEIKIITNSKRQTELRQQLERLEVDEQNLKKERRFQKEVQERAKQVHDEVMHQLSYFEHEISDINARILTAKQVIESMESCGEVLIGASISAEKEYVQQLKLFVAEAKKRQRLVLATKAVDKRIKIDHSLQNIDDYKERIKVSKSNLKKAVQRRQTLIAKQEEDTLKEFTREKKKEEEIHNEAIKCHTEVMEKLRVLDEELLEFGVEVMSVDELYEIRQQELVDIICPTNDGYSSLELSDTDN